MIGRTISHYEILAKLGQGAMGVVYKAHDLSLRREVAIKFLAHPPSAQGGELDRFVREARAAAALSHSNIITVHEIDDSHSEVFIVMEYVDGGTIEERLRAGCSCREAAELAVQIADGLAAAHERGVIHRDIKPSNVMIRRDGRVAIADFGLARISGATRLTRSDTSIGTTAYMAPEVILGQPASARSDLFAVGVLFYELVTGRLPFGGELAVNVMYGILNEEPPRPGALRPDLDAELEQIILGLLSKKPDERYQTAAELADDLRTYIRGSGSAPIRRARPTRSRPGARPRIGRRRLIAAGVLVVATSAALLFLQRRAIAVQSVAILPFTASVADSSTALLEEGLTGSLTESLSRIPRLRVIARASAERFRGGDVDPQTAGRRLGVQAVLVGEILERAGHLKVDTELVNVSTNGHLWGHQYSEPLARLLQLQEGMSTDLARVLRPELTPAAGRRIARPITRNSEAYRLFLRGQHAWAGMLDSSAREAGSYYRAAIEADPTFAEAYARLALTYLWLSNTDFKPEDAASLSRAAIQKALALDPDLADAHYALAMSHLQLDWDWNGADHEFQRASECNPGSEEIHTQYGYFLLAMLRLDDAQRELRESCRLDPLSIPAQVYLGAPAFYRRHYDEAIRQFRSALAQDTTSVLARYWIAFAHEQQGRLDEAIGEMESLTRVADDSAIQMELARVYALAGRPDKARKLERVLRERKRWESSGSPGGAARIAAGFGDKDAAIEALEAACRAHDTSIHWLKADPDFDSLRPDPRFRALMHRLHLDT